MSRFFVVRTGALLCLIVFAAFLPACSREVKRPRTRDDVFQDRQKVPVLYLAADGQSTTAPGNPDRAVVIDAASGKLAWPAWECNNPKCPGRKSPDEPSVFPWPDPFMSAKEGGGIAIRQPISDADMKLMDDFAEQKCPHCLATRNLASETPEQRQQYKDWCQPHVLPAAAKQLQELDAELKQILEIDQKARGR